MSQKYKRVSVYEMSETIAKLKRKYNSNSFTFRDAIKYLSEMNQDRVLSILRKAKHNGLVRVISKRTITQNGYKKAANVYVIPDISDAGIPAIRTTYKIFKRLS